MAKYTRYLVVTAEGASEQIVQIATDSPRAAAEAAIRSAAEFRYSPIMPAFLAPNEDPPLVPDALESISFLFSSRPYFDLGTVKPKLNANERGRTYFSEGLASIVMLNTPVARAREIRAMVGDCPFEYWPISGGKLTTGATISDGGNAQTVDTDPLQLPSTEEAELEVYVEQISASLTTLWAAYHAYYPEEKETLRRLSRVTDLLIQQHKTLRAERGAAESLINQTKANAIVSALVELSASLSYTVTQGTSGVTPILCNRSPFPHHSLLGIGGSVRALTKFTRYLESAFVIRNAGDVVRNRYSEIRYRVPASIPTYNSGSQYRFPESREATDERFDAGGDFAQQSQVPLVAYFSLRHGFMESKFSVTAASESLTAETEPQWTLMTLSHEVMHSRVRSIFVALFGTKWDEENDEVIRTEQFRLFSQWIEARNLPGDQPIAAGLRNAILNFCYAIDRFANGLAAPEDPAMDPTTPEVPIEKMRECYSRNKQLAVETLVHFHDYYFAYAYQPKMYMMSVWASWIKVAAPFTRTLEYLVRSLATVACGTGLEPREAFDAAVDILIEALDGLEAAGVRSPLFLELRRLSQSADEVEATRASFKVFYYLIDQVRLFFASPSIAAKIDRVEEDPFAEGSTLAEEYSANVFVFGEEAAGSVSPIRYSLAALFTSLAGKPPVDDPQWLTAWNYMVISS
jgi:hypothetical protein